MSVTIQVSIQTTKGPGIWKLNTKILKQKQFQNTFKKFWSSWTKEKPKYENHNDWWEIGKMYFKSMAIEYSTEKNRQIKNKYNQCIKIINEEKTKPQPDTMKIKICEIELEEIENYKKQETVIRSKEKIILNEEIDQILLFTAKTKTKEKTSNNSRKRTRKIYNKNLSILKECTNYY